MTHRHRLFGRRDPRRGGVPSLRDAPLWACALLLCAGLLVTLLPSVVGAADGYDVRFVNYDLGQLEGDGYSLGQVPEGTRLVTADELGSVSGFSPSEGCSWYLYLEGGEGTGFGPTPVPDPPAREGYVFRDWAAQGAGDDTLYTVTGDTTFVARYLSEGHYVINLYYQFDNDEHSVAAETTTAPFGFGESFSIALPATESLEGLSPQITISSTDEAVQDAVQGLNAMISNGSFSGSLDDSFLELCKVAGFVTWDNETNDYLKDEGGNVQVSIPVTYAVTGDVGFTVEYWLQNADDDGYAQSGGSATGTVSGTTRVCLNDLGLVKSFEGFSLTASSSEDAASYTVNANGTSVIKLYYDRNVHYLYYQMNGGNAIDPIELRYGQAIPSEATKDGLAVRAGYTFEEWLWLDGDGSELDSAPSTMPDHDLTLEASWVGADTTVTLVYWLENANDDSYTVTGQRTISVTSGQTVGYSDPDHTDTHVDVAINGYLSPEEMEAAGITDGEYFTFSQADSSTQYAPGTEGGPKTAAGDGSTVINIGYTRNEYTLVFHLGKISDGSIWGETAGWYYISTSGNSFSNDPSDWTSGYTGWTAGGKAATLTMNGTKYTISNDEDECYQITAKYGAYISGLWPVATDESTSTVTVNNITYRLFTWGTHAMSPYFKTHTSNHNIIGVYPTMSAELIIDPSNPNVVHHLTAYWSSSTATKTHHYMFEAVPGTTGIQVSFDDYSSYKPVNVQGAGGSAAVQGLSFYEYSSTSVRTSAEAERQNAPAFANVTYQYGCYKGDDVYFFYTYNDYTLTYHENNANQANQVEAITRTVDFHYVEGKPVAELIEGADYVPQQPFVSSYGNEYEFVGWFTSNGTADERFAVNWDTFAPSSNVSVYAAWKAPTFTLTLVVPGGTLYDDSLQQFEDEGYTCTYATETDPVTGEQTTTYTVSGIPEGTKASEIVKERHGAESAHGLTFDYWSYVTPSGTEQRYLFDESQLVTGDLTLTAQWKTEYAGQYTVRYLTSTAQDNDLGTVEIEGKTFYRLREDKIVTGVAVGSSVTEEAASIKGFLSATGQITKMVEAPEGDAVRTYFDFVYSPASGSVTYTVHYVRDTGVDYGRVAPPEGIERLAEDKTVTVEEASLASSTTVSEAAVMVGGYTPRDSWNVSLTLSSSGDENHLYIYYVSNTHLVSFSATYHFMDEEGKYPEGDALVFKLSAQDALGRTIRAQELVDGYDRYLTGSDDLDRLSSLMVGHVLDTTLTSPLSILLTQKTSTSSGETENVIHIYMKNADYTLTYDLNDGDDAEHSASWDDADYFLVDGEGGTLSQTITYPNPASVPTTCPERLSYAFVGWSASADGSDTVYGQDELSDAPWYTEKGLSSDVTLYAQWESKLMVTFDLRGGSWSDPGDELVDVGTEGNPVWVSYVAKGSTPPQPADPTYVLPDGTAYSFIGWTTTSPDSDEWKSFVGSDNAIDPVAFESHRFDFSQPVNESLTLYAVWDPDVTTFDIVKTDTNETSPRLLEGASFTLERLEATVTKNDEGGYDYALVVGNDGEYQTDEGFVPRAIVTNQDGTGSFENLPAGYYRLKETQAPDGYATLIESAILFAPYKGSPELHSPSSSYVTAQGDAGKLEVTVRNTPQYGATITGPDSLTLTYEAPDFIWNPETMRYEAQGADEGRWSVTSPSGTQSQVTVTNTSPAGSSVSVSAEIGYLDGYEFLLPLSKLVADSDSGLSVDAGTGQLIGTLAAGSSASFELTVEGTLPYETPLPTDETNVGAITVIVSRPSG